MKNIYHNYIARQLRKPTGLFGKIVSNKMQRMNQPIYDWMFTILEFGNAKNVLEIGYGTGIIMNKIVSVNKKLMMYGIDFSRVMFEKAKLNNEEFIEEGRIQLVFGDLLDYNTSISFDVIYSLNAIYFWKELRLYFEKIFSLMNTGGILYLYMRDSDNFRTNPVGRTGIFNLHQTENIRSQLKSSGFKQIDFIEKKIKGFDCFCVKAMK